MLFLKEYESTNDNQENRASFSTVSVISIVSFLQDIDLRERLCPSKKVYDTTVR